ncbi:unnamed protein product [Triticum turgidum subsp. durum]|uniref:KIB1-4 beta-propeller domain-containing protein n=1 Tax=Triticum turgidum subsp. durum TaxID=4567 RepID=A0A9R0R0E6_TRITD|nr:unnamed protein product [Triticum turgidum subsp. durum]
MSWSDLPTELVAGIADRITEHVDLARFRSVCPSWRSASAEHAARRRVPLLLLPSQQNSRVNRSLWSLADDSITEIPMPAACGRSFLFASPRGWTLAVADDFSATLLHPFTGASESLPALPPSFHDGYQMILRDMVWDRSPDAVMVSQGKGAFFCRLQGDGRSWTPADLSPPARVGSITYCDGAFYLLDKRANKVTAVDGATFAVAAAIEPPDLAMPDRSWARESTLVVSSASELLLVVHGGCHRSKGLFKAFHADRGSLVAGWSEVSGGGLGDRAVFVDHARGFCVEANGVNGVRRNCVYVASAHEEANANANSGWGDWGRYTVSMLDLDGLTTQNLSHGNLLKCLHGRQRPSWSMPNLH